MPLNEAVDQALESSPVSRKSKVSVVYLVLETTVAAAVIAIVALNAFFGLNYVVLAQSVSNLPAGTLAVTSTVDAASLAIGDVVTVDSASGGLATYSISALAPVSDKEAARQVTVGTDAAGEPVSLQLATASRVVFAAPGMGNVAVAASTPALTAFAALMVLVMVAQLGGSKTSKARVSRRAHVAKAA